jgi:hypothetical protein
MSGLPEKSDGMPLRPRLRRAAVAVTDEER